MMTTALERATLLMLSGAVFLAAAELTPGRPLLGFGLSIAGGFGLGVLGGVLGRAWLRRR